MINQVDQVIDSNDIGRLQHLRQSLLKNSDVLTQLDEELIEITPDDDLEGEIEQVESGCQSQSSSSSSPSRSSMKASQTHRNLSETNSMTVHLHVYHLQSLPKLALVMAQ